MQVVVFIPYDEKEETAEVDINSKFNISVIKLSNKDYSIKKDSIITVGTFDGMHLGHGKILNTLITKSNELNLRKVVVTFEPHPRLILINKERKGIKLLTTLEEKLNYFQQTGIDIVFIIKFTEEFSKTSAVEFFENYLINKIGLKFLIIGYDHTFGKNREGNYETVKLLSEKYNFGYLKVDEFRINNEIVSSTVIRKLINNYDIEKASAFLGRNYSITGKVVYGEKHGKELGFPTANIQVTEKNKLIPPDGVYAVKVFIDNNAFLGMMNIGIRPTINKYPPKGENQVKYLEVHIFDFDRDIYGNTITVEFIKFIRNEKKFNSLAELTEQLKSDKRTIESLK